MGSLWIDALASSNTIHPPRRGETLLLNAATDLSIVARNSFTTSDR